MTARAWFTVLLVDLAAITVLVWWCAIQRIAERLRLRAARRRVTAAAVANARKAFRTGPLPGIPASRLHDAGGHVQIGGRTVHRSCNEARRDGRPVCAACADRLGMAPTGGAG